MKNIKHTNFKINEHYGEGSHVGTGNKSHTGSGSKVGENRKSVGGHEHRGHEYGHGGYSQSPAYLNRGLGGWYLDYPNNYYIYPIFVETSSNSPSISNEQLENVAKIEFPEGKWQIKSEPPTCSYIQARWKNKNELSTNSDCYCPVGNKVEKIIDNQKMYKCDLLLNN